MLYVDPRLSASGQNRDEADKTPIAMPIRGLAKKDGKLQQPVQLRIENSGPDALCITRIDGQEVDSRGLAPGVNTFNVYLPPVQAVRPMQVECEIAGRSAAAQVLLEPVRKVQIFILPHSHHDLGYTDLQADVEEKQMGNISKGMELAQNTASTPPGRDSCGTSKCFGERTSLCAKNRRRIVMPSSPR
jgi:alpha-mannosidase